MVLEVATSPWQRAARHQWQVQHLPDVTGQGPGFRKEPPVLSQHMQGTIQCQQPQEKSCFAEAALPASAAVRHNRRDRLPMRCN